MSEASPGNESKRGWFEPVVAILMGAGTLATAWCSYQSSLWSGRGSDQSARADKLDREAAAMHLESQQVEAAHLQLVCEAIDARIKGDEKLGKFYTDRMAGELKPAWNKWIALDPFNTPSAPPNPFAPGLYQPRFHDEIRQARAEATQAVAEANTGSAHASSYLRLTVLPAIVLFFAGSATTFDQRRVRHGALGFAIALAVYAFIRIAMLPRG